MKKKYLLIKEVLLKYNGKSKIFKLFLTDIKPHVKKPIFFKNGNKFKNLSSKNIKTFILFFLKKFTINLINELFVEFFKKKFVFIFHKKLKWVLFDKKKKLIPMFVMLYIVFI